MGIAFSPIQYEENIKFQALSGVAFGKSKPNILILPIKKMPVLPETYGFVLDADYRYVRHWALTGELPEKREYLARWLLIYGVVIRFWVKHNEAHRKMIEKSSVLKFKPMIKYEEFYEQYLRVDRWLENSKNANVFPSLTP